jgi:hypothetical protein
MIPRRSQIAFWLAIAAMVALWMADDTAFGGVVLPFLPPVEPGTARPSPARPGEYPWASSLAQPCPPLSTAGPKLAGGFGSRRFLGEYQ